MQMNEKNGKQVLIDKLPDLTKLKTALKTYIPEFIIFIIISVFFFIISSYIWFGAILAQIIFCLFSTVPFVILTRNADKIRKKYRDLYKDLAFQKVWYRYLFYVTPFDFSNLYFIILLKTDYFLPEIINLPPHLITKTFFPIYFALTIGIILIIFGSLIRRPSGGFDVDIDCYVYLIFPEESRHVEGGIYRFIRHPRYTGRILIAFGLGFIANNILALILGIIHFLSYYMLLSIEDTELKKRFKDTHIKYLKETPALIPKIKHWKEFLKTLIK